MWTLVVLGYLYGAAHYQYNPPLVLPNLQSEEACHAEAARLAKLQNHLRDPDKRYGEGIKEVIYDCVGTGKLP